MRLFIQKYRDYFYSTLFIIFALLLIFPFTSRISVIEGDAYFTKEEVALYIYEYHDLPINFLTKGESDLLYPTYLDAISDGYNIGGDTFLYLGTITSMTKDSSLVECDIYQSREQIIQNQLRGQDRIVFTSNGEEVFFTADHYASFSRMSIWKIQKISIIWWGVFFAYDVMLTIFIIYGLRKNWFEKDELKVYFSHLIAIAASFLKMVSELTKIISRKLYLLAKEFSVRIKSRSKAK